jgi:hypothetical protein
MSDLPKTVDRHEDVHVHEDPVGVERSTVVHDAGAERNQIAHWINSLIWFFFGVINVLIALRFALKLIAANPGNAFAAMVYGVTDLFLLPFFGLTITPTLGGMVFEIHSLIAIAVYTLVAWLLTRLVGILMYQPASRVVATEERYQDHTH